MPRGWAAAGALSADQGMTCDGLTPRRYRCAARHRCASVPASAAVVAATAVGVPSRAAIAVSAIALAAAAFAAPPRPCGEGD